MRGIITRIAAVRLPDELRQGRPAWEIVEVEVRSVETEEDKARRVAAIHAIMDAAAAEARANGFTKDQLPEILDDIKRKR